MLLRLNFAVYTIKEFMIMKTMVHNLIPEKCSWRNEPVTIQMKEMWKMWS